MHDINRCNITDAHRYNETSEQIQLEKTKCSEANEIDCSDSQRVLLFGCLLLRWSIGMNEVGAHKNKNYVSRDFVTKYGVRPQDALTL